MTPRQHAEHRLGQIARPAFDPRGVAAEPAQRGDAPIAVNQNQTLPALQNFDRRIGHCNARHNLATPLNRARNPLDRSRFRHTRTGKAQIEAVQIESQALRVHAPELAAQSARSYHVVSLQTSAASPYGVDIKVISTTHAIFANSAALAGTSR